MKLLESEVTECQQIFFEEKGVELSRAEAAEELMNLINLMRLLR